MYKGLKQPLGRSEGLYKRVMETILLAPFKQRATHSDKNIKCDINHNDIEKKPDSTTESGFPYHS